jgi:small-conductance mechanosensitive channel
MSKQKNVQYRFGGPFNLIIAVVALFLVFFILSRIVSWLWQLALFAMPFLLIATFFMNRRIITGYIGTIRKLYKRNSTTGIIATVLSVIASPLLSVIFFGQAMFQRRLKKEQQKTTQEQQNKFGEYIDYEELDTTLNLNEPPRRKTKVEKETPPPKEENKNPYDSLWE